MYKSMKKILTIAILLAITFPAVASNKLATLINPSTGERKVVEVGCSSCFDGGWELDTRKDYMIGGSSPFQPSGIDVNIRQSLVAGSSRTDTTLNIDPMITFDGHRMVFSDFNSAKAFAKIDQGTDNEEIIYFTGITDNTTYYTLTGVVWGCNFYDDTCDVDANKKRHSSGGDFIITNDWHFVNENYVSLTTAQSISGVKTFTVSPLGPTPSSSETTALATVEYVNDVATSGSANLSTTIKGIAEGATQAEMAAGTTLGDTGAALVLLGQYASSTSEGGIGAVITGSDGKIDESFIDYTVGNTYSGNNTFTGTTTMATSSISKIILTATSTDWNSAQSKKYIDDNNLVPIAASSSDVLKGSDDSVSQTEPISYTEVKSFISYVAGTMKIKFDLQSETGSYAAWGRIYKNGVAIGTERTTSSTSYVTYSETLNIGAGDTVSLYVKTNNTASDVMVRNYRIYFDINQDTNGISY